MTQMMISKFIGISVAKAYDVVVDTFVIDAPTFGTSAKVLAIGKYTGTGGKVRC